MTFGHENFVKGPANLFTQALADLRLDGLLTLIAMTYGRLGDLLVLLRYPEQLQGTSREFNAQLETTSLRKMKDWRTLLLQHLLPQNRSVTGEDKVATDAGECKQYCGMPLLTELAAMMRIDPLLNFWVERIKETGMLMVEQPKLGIILEERVVEPSVPELRGQVSFDCGSWDGPLKTSLVTMWELMKPSWCPHPNAGLIWDMTADITLDLDDDASLHDLAMIHHLLAMRVTKRKINPSTEPSEESPSSNWLRQGTCLAQHSGMEGHVCNLGHCLITLSEQHRNWHDCTED